jgi:hypothetical protein
MGFVICEDPIYITYAFIIFTSATLSVVWHASGELPGKLMEADYFFAGLWSVYEIFVSVHYFHNELTKLGIVVGLSLIVLASNKAVDYWGLVTKVIDYDKGHSIWHLISAAKFIIVAGVLGNV